MEYQGLTEDDLANVRALNTAWLELQERVAGVRLSTGRRERLAAAPFLLFTFREQDEALWRRLLADRRQQDLLSEPRAAPAEYQPLQATGLAFLWELSRRNPYVARLVCAASIGWCERIASVTLVRVLDSAKRCETIEWRFEPETREYRRLLRRGSGAPRDLRKSAQISLLQSMLTTGESARYGRLPAAACHMAIPSREVADKL